MRRAIWMGSIFCVMLLSAISAPESQLMHPEEAYCQTEIHWADRGRDGICECVFEVCFDESGREVSEELIECDDFCMFVP